VLPGGKAALNLSDIGGRHVELVELATGRRDKIEGLPEAIDYLMYQDEFIIVQAGTVLWAAPFDIGKRRITDQPFVLLPAVRLAADGGFRESQSGIGGGTLAYVPASGNNHLVLVGRDGRETVLPDTLGSFHRPRFSPDGRQLSTDITRGAGRDVWVYDFDQHTMSRLSFVPYGHDAIWAPDGQRLIFAATLRDTLLGLFAQRNDGSAVAETLSVLPGSGAPEAVLPDGRILTYTVGSGTREDAWLITPGANQPKVLLGGPFREDDLALSRDGQWLAWTSDESGHSEVYLRSIEGGPRIQVSTSGGGEPAWGRNNGELFYRGTGSGGPLVVVRLSLDPLRVLSRITLFDAGQYDESTPHNNYDYDPVNDRFVFVRTDMPNEIRVIRDWHALLERR
jgi:Tol biopolymer transport system component